MGSGTANLPDSKPCWDGYDADGWAWTGFDVCAGREGLGCATVLTTRLDTQPLAVQIS